VIVYLSVYNDDGGSTEFELFTKGGTWLEYIVPWSSTANPNNATEYNVISVGAVTWSNYGAPPGSTGVARPYSSQGPSNSGTPLPDICGPTDCTAFSYPNGMGGTSNSCPNCAGAAVCLWASDPLMAPEAISWLIMEQAYLYLDWGDPGHDLIYGSGGMKLIEPAPNTLWVSRLVYNIMELREYPFFTVAAAQSNAVPGGRIVFIPGGDYPEPVFLNKQLRYITLGYPAILGE
jgi:subtilisin family serine protease